MYATRNPLLVVVGLSTAILPTICLFVSLNLLFPIPLVVGLACALAGTVKNWPATNRAWTAVGLMICLTSAVGPFALRAIGDRPGKPLRIVLPVGYKGEFSIVSDPKNGMQLQFRDGRWVFEIPDSGVLYVSNTHLFHVWHQEEYFYSDGRRANVRSRGAGYEDRNGYVQTDCRFEVVDERDLSQR